MAGGGGPSSLGNTWRLLVGKACGKDRRGAKVRAIKAVLLTPFTHVYTSCRISKEHVSCADIVFQHCHALTFLILFAWHSVSPNRCEHTRCCTEGADRSVRLVRDHGNLHILQIGPTSPKWTVSIQRGRNMRPTWGQLRPARPQLRPNLDQLAPTSA